MKVFPMRTGKLHFLKILSCFMTVYQLIFWLCLVSDLLHIAIWFFCPEAIDDWNIYRAVLGAISFVAIILLTFLTLVPIEILTNIQSVQPFQARFPGKTKWIVCLPVAVSLLSLALRLVLDLSGKLPFQEMGQIIWALATINSIASAAGILQIRHFKLEMQQKGLI